MFGRTGLDNGTQWFPSDPNVVPLRTFHRLTSRNGGISVVKPCFDCCCCCCCCCCWCIIIPALVDDDDGDDDCCFAAVDDILLLITLGGWLHSTTATIHPFDAVVGCRLNFKVRTYKSKRRRLFDAVVFVHCVCLRWKCRYSPHQQLHHLLLNYFHNLHLHH